MPIKPDIAKSTEIYRSATANQLWLSHIRKKCDCGKTITEKQLRQYKMCASCYKQSKLIGESA